MPSARFVAALTGAQTSEAPVLLVTLTHASWAAPLRFCEGGADLVSNGDTFLARAMSVSLPGESRDQGARRGRLALDDTDRAIVSFVRTAPTKPSALLQVVLAGYPDDVELSWPGLSVVAYAAGVDRLELELALRDDSVEIFPVQSFSPAPCPGLF